jgi:chemotaxis protein CheC
MNLTLEQMDALKELINIGVGRAAGVLNEMLQSHVRLRVPSIKVLSLPELDEEMKGLNEESLSAVQLPFKGPFSGTASLVFPTESAANLVGVLIGDETGTPDLDSIKIGALTEVGNIVLNGVMGSIGNVLQLQVEYAVPTYMEGNVGHLVAPDVSEHHTTILLAETRFTVEHLHVDGNIILIFEVGAFDALLDAIQGSAAF